MGEHQELDWYNADDPAALWDAAEVPIETKDGVVHVCPSVGGVEGPDARVAFSIDIPEGRHGIRSLASGFAETLDAARAAAAEAIKRIAQGLKAI